MANRRKFLQAIGLAGGGLPGLRANQPPAGAKTSRISFPRVFSDRQLPMIAFPLGGVAAGSISLGGRGQLRDWEIFNRPDKGLSPSYAFPSLWVQSGNAKPVARVLEARFAPPYEGQNGLGSNNVPGLRRMESARFTGEYPFARIDFRDAHVPVKVSLEAFSPFIPHDADNSGLPAAILRYRVRNTQATEATVSIAWSIENMTGRGPGVDTRRADHRSQDGLQGLLLNNPALPAGHETKGSFALTAIASGADVTALRGWPRAR